MAASLLQRRAKPFSDVTLRARRGACCDEQRQRRRRTHGLHCTPALSPSTSFSPPSPRSPYAVAPASTASAPLMGRRDGLDERAYSFPPAYANAHGRHPHQRPALGAQGAQVPDASLRAAHASVGRPPRPSHRRAAPMEWSRSRASTTVRRAHRRRSDVAAGTGGSTPRPGLSARPGAAANRPGAQPSAAGPGRGPGVKPGEHQAGVSPRTGGAHPGMRPTRRPRRHGPRGSHHHLGAGRGEAPWPAAI